MIVLLNQERDSEIYIENKVFNLKNFQAILLNAYEESVYIKSNNNINLIAIRFKGAGASFFYEDEMAKLMEVPKEPIYIDKSIVKTELDNYFKNLLTPSKLPFNIMKIIDLLDEQGSNYSIDEVLAVANVPRKILDKMFRLKSGLTFKTYATLKELDSKRV